MEGRHLCFTNRVPSGHSEGITRLGIKRHPSTLHASVRLDIQNKIRNSKPLAGAERLCFGISSCQCVLQLHIRE